MRDIPSIHPIRGSRDADDHQAQEDKTTNQGTAFAWVAAVPPDHPDRATDPISPHER
jgi:hypothetical protein